MILIVGLGNPGEKFEKTRHNIGFMIVESLKLKVKSFSDWKNNKKFLSEISEGEINDQKVIFAKPQTMMNNSGKAVKALLSNVKCQMSNVVVIHDDIDLPLGKIRISKGRGAAGHKGVESIIRELKTKNFVRFRIGINQFAQNQKSTTAHFQWAGLPSPYSRAVAKIKNQKLDEFVLEKFTKDEKRVVKEVIEKTCEAIEFSLKQGLEKAMARFNV